MGCPVNAKQGMLLTTIPDAINGGMRLFADTYAERLIVENDRVIAVEARVKDPTSGRPGPHQIKVHAKNLVSSCGALHGRFFLRSGINDNGLVGQRSFIHPVVGVGKSSLTLSMGFTVRLNLRPLINSSTVARMKLAFSSNPHPHIQFWRQRQRPNLGSKHNRLCRVSIIWPSSWRFTGMGSYPMILVEL